MKYLRLIGIFLFIFILWQVDWGKALSIVIGMDYAAPIVAGLLNIAIMIVKAWRWHMLLRSQKISLSFSDALRIYVSAYYYGALTPGRLGEILKVFYLKRYCGTSAAVGLSSVLTDRLMDIYVSFILGCLGIYYFRLLGSMSLLGLVLPLLSLLFIGVLFHRKSALFLVDRFSRIFLLRRISARAEVFVREFTGAALAFITPALWLPVAITLATYAVFFYGCLIVAQALGIDISYLDIAIVVSIGSIVSMIPISIAGLGTREAVLIMLFAGMGVGSDTAVSFSLLMLLTFTVLLGLVGYVAWLLTPFDKPQNDDLKLEKLQDD